MFFPVAASTRIACASSAKLTCASQASSPGQRFSRVRGEVPSQAPKNQIASKVRPAIAERGVSQLAQTEPHAGKQIDSKIANEVGHIADINGDKSMGAALAEKSVDYNVLDVFGRSPLHVAVEKSNRNMVLHLLEQGADINIRDKSGRTPLFWAVDRGDWWMVYVLLKQGADVNVLDHERKTPLYLAVRDSDEDIVYLLMDKNANPILPGFGGVLRPWALSKKDFRIAQLLKGDI